MTESRPLRADARRNRDAIITAARTVFGERGLDAPLEDVAQMAGVGSATLYRRFPTKVHLIEATFEPELRAYTAVVERGLAEPDAWQGFARTMLEIWEMQASDRALADLVTMAPPSRSAALQDLAVHGSQLIHQLVARAKASGDLRPDFTAQDVVLLFMANAGVVHRTFADAPESWRRSATFILDGLRNPPRTAALGEPPSEEAVWRAMGRA